MEAHRPAILAVDDESTVLGAVASAVGEGSMAVSLIHEYLAGA